jgi:hypothetical protein
VNDSPGELSVSDIRFAIANSQDLQYELANDFPDQRSVERILRSADFPRGRSGSSFPAGGCSPGSRLAWTPPGGCLSAQTLTPIRSPSAPTTSSTCAEPAAGDLSRWR